MDRQAGNGHRFFGSLPYPLGLAIFLVQVALGILLFAVFQKYVPDSLGAGDAYGGYLLAAYGAARFVFETPTGAISDRIERRLGLLLGFALMLPAIGLMAATTNEHLFLAYAAMLGFATAFLWPATYALAADLYPPERRGRVIGFLNLTQLLGFGVGALAGAFMVEEGGDGLFFVALAGVSAAFGAALLGVPNYRGAKLFAFIDVEHRPSVRTILSKRLVFLSAIILSTSIALSMLVPVIRPFGEEQLGVSFAKLTVALIPSILVGAALYVPAGHFADRFGRTPPLLAGLLLVAGGLVAMAETRDLPVAMLAAVAVFSGNVLTVPAWNAAVMDLAPPTHRGTLIGLSVALSGLGLALGPALGGALVGAWGPPDAFRVAAALSVATSAAVFVYGRTYRERR